MINRIISSRIKYFSAFIIYLIMVLCAFAPCVNAEFSTFNNKKIVVLDPGHGGYDEGATGPEGTYEKTITLNLAQMIATELENKYRPVLTRTEDYSLDIYDRTAVANHLEAELFVSIHVAGSFLHKANGITVYYFKEKLDPNVNFEGTASKNDKTDSSQYAWNNIQKKYIKKSRAFAELMQLQISDKIKQAETKMHGAPIALLSGADMPAVLIEIGYISNPDEEKRMNDPEFLSEFAKVICETISNFLSGKPDNISCADN